MSAPCVADGPLFPVDPAAPAYRTRIIGHRGLPGRLPENTVASLRAAAGAGADLVEVDVKTTRDGVVILMHDETVDRTTDGTGAVDHLTFREVRALRAGGEPVPTLEEALAGVDCPFMVDFDRVREAIALRPLLAAPAVRRRVLLTGGNADAHGVLREAYPDIAISMSAAWAVTRGDLWHRAAAVRAQYLNPQHVGVRAAFVARARAAGYGVSTWTVDRPSSIRRLLGLGVDLLITNRTDLAVAALGARP